MTFSPEAITQAAVASFAACDNPRLKEIMQSLVKHLHAFAQETKLTEAEWMAGIQFLTATGHKCDDVRQEFILLSDTLGLSMLLVAMHDGAAHGATEATVLGPFHTPDAPLLENGSLMDIPARSWSYITLGFGHGEEWWRQFCYRLKMGGYDGWLSIEHEDVLLNSLEGLEKSVSLLQGVMPKAPADYQPQAI